MTKLTKQSRMTFIHYAIHYASDSPTNQTSLQSYHKGHIAAPRHRTTPKDTTVVLRHRTTPRDTTVAPRHRTTPKDHPGTRLGVFPGLRAGRLMEKACSERSVEEVGRRVIHSSVAAIIIRSTGDTDCPADGDARQGASGTDRSFPGPAGPWD